MDFRVLRFKVSPFFLLRCFGIPMRNSSHPKKSFCDFLRKRKKFLGFKKEKKGDCEAIAMPTFGWQSLFFFANGKPF